MVKRTSITTELSSLPAKRFKDATLAPDTIGLADPCDDPSLSTCAATPVPASPSAPLGDELAPLKPVWAKMVGYKPTWSPAIVSYIYTEHVTGPNRMVVFFLESFVNSSEMNERMQSIDPRTHLQLPKWFIEEEGMRITPSDYPRTKNIQNTFLNPHTCVKPWSGSHMDSFIKNIESVSSSARKKLLLGAVELANHIHQSADCVPQYVRKDYMKRASIQAHCESQLVSMDSVRLQLKLHHLKLFLESNMIELHWRTIGYARQYVKAVADEIFGGFHLIAAQDWPTDKDVDNGVPDVFLIYPGTVLTESEAIELENACKSGIHEDRNRYVAEIPNTAVIFDKTKTVNINSTGTNLFVDGFKYADPTSPIWAPGPTVNHERVKYCKLAPHHVTGTSDSMRGFWLQRKRGEVITKGEPLFWSYDCGAGKFDKDYGLTASTPPPIGWRSTEEILRGKSGK